MLTGHQEYVEEGSEPTELNLLRDQVAELQKEVNVIKGILMRQYGAFKSSYGDQAIVTTDSADKWIAIKARMAPRLREAIDVLLLQSRMSPASLKCRPGRTFAIGCHAERKASASMFKVSKIAVCRKCWRIK